LPGQSVVLFTYNPDFGESIETLSVEHVFNLGQLACIDGLYIGPKLVVGMVQANDYNGGNKVLGHNWRNGYTYFELQLNADYEVYHGVYLHAGAEWAMNNDGSGSQGIGGTNLGPDDNVSFRAVWYTRFKGARGSAHFPFAAEA